MSFLSLALCLPPPPFTSFLLLSLPQIFIESFLSIKHINVITNMLPYKQMQRFPRLKVLLRLVLSNIWRRKELCFWRDDIMSRHWLHQGKTGCLWPSPKVQLWKESCRFCRCSREAVKLQLTEGCSVRQWFS